MSSPTRYGWLWFALGDVSSKVSTFVVLSQVSKHFASTQAEAFVLAQTVTSLLIAAGDLGFRALGTRHMARATDSESIGELARIIQQRRIAAAAMLGIPVACAAVLSLSEQWETRCILAYLSLCWLPYFFGYDWALLSLGDFRRLTWSRLANVAMILAATLCGRVFGLGIWCIGFGYAAGYATANLIAVRGIPKLRSGSASTSQRSLLRDAISAQTSWRASLTLAVSFAANALFHAQEVLLTGHLLGTATAARFGASFRLILTACSLGWLATQYLSPRLAQSGGASWRTQLSYALPLCLWGGAATLGALALGPLLTQLIYGNTFYGATTILRQLTPIIFLDSISALLGTVLVMQGHDRASVISLTIGLLGSLLTFLSLYACSAAAGTALPIAAKYAGYICLLAAQLRYVIALASEQSHAEDVSSPAGKVAAIAHD